MAPRKYSMETRAADTANTRERILAAVRELLLEDGIERITLQGVAVRADLALRTLYNHFPSRSSLVSATLLDLAGRVGAAALHGWQADPTHPRQGLQSYIAGVYGTYAEYAPWFDVLLGPTSDPELQETGERLRSRGRMGAIALLTTAQDGGRLRVSLQEAQTLVSIHTLYGVWKHLSGDLGLSVDAAAAVVSGFLNRAIFIDE